MSKRPEHLPHDNPNHATVWEYPSFPSDSREESAHLLDSLDVRQVTAIQYQCTAHWDMPERRIADDMFFMILDGHGEARVAGRRSTLAPGDCAHWRRGVAHSCSQDPKRPIRVISIHYTATVSGSATVAELFDFPDVFRFGRKSPLIPLFEQAAREFAHRPPGWQTGLSALIARLLLDLVRDPALKLRAPISGSLISDLRRLQPALGLLRRDFAAPKTIPDLAKRCGVSPAQFRRLFHRACGCSPIDYQRRERFNEACRLLRHTDAPVENIAAQVGYAEPSFFAQSFRRLIGVSPGKYRKNEHL